MGSEHSQEVIVHEGGRMEAVFPELIAGEHVQLVVRADPSRPRPRKLGSMQGLITHVSADFDDPLPEFEPHTG